MFTLYPALSVATGAWYALGGAEMLYIPRIYADSKFETFYENVEKQKSQQDMDPEERKKERMKERKKFSDMGERARSCARRSLARGALWEGFACSQCCGPVHDEEFTGGLGYSKGVFSYANARVALVA